jgi:hypothetical protein
MTIELTRMVGYHDLLADLQRPGCPICHGADRAVWRYLDGLLWESVNDAGVRMGLRASHGYCRAHSVMFLRVADAHVGSHGLAILLEDLLMHVVADAELEASAKNRRRGSGPLRPEAPCSACVLARHTEESYVRILAASEEGSAPYEGIGREARGICLPHLAFGLSLIVDARQRARLVATFRRGTEELTRELSEFVRKQDYRYHHERITDGEASSWRRGVFRLVGEPKPTREPPR